jgi:hypothetical protein
MNEPSFSNLQWRKSSHSGSQSGTCVELAQAGPVIAVRDSKDPDGPVLLLEPSQWRALRHRLRFGA